MARKKKSAMKKKRASGGAAVEVGAATAEEPIAMGEGKMMLEEEVDEGNGTDESSLVSSAVVENEEDEVVLENGGESASCCADGSCAKETPTVEPPVEIAAETSTEEDVVGEMAMEDNSCASKGCCSGGGQESPPVVLNEHAVEELEAQPCTTGCCGEKADPPPPLPSAETTSGGGACCSNVQDGDGVVDTCCSSPPPPPLATAKESPCCASSSTGCSSKSKAPVSSSSSCSATPKTMADRVKALKSDRENLLRHPTPSLPSAPSRGGLRVDTLRLRIGGMTCSGCCTRIESFLSEQPGIFGVNVSLLTSRGAVDYDPNALSPEYIETLVTTLGFTAESMPSDTLAAVVLFVGRDPPQRVRQKLLGIEGVVSVRDYSKQHQSQSSSKPLDLATAGQNSVLVEYDPDVLGARTLVRKLSASMGGFHVQASAPRPHTVESEEQDAAKFAVLLLWSCLLSLPVLFVAYIAPLLGADVQAAVAREILVGLSWQDLVGFMCATPILLVVAYPIHESAFLALRFSSRVTMDVLISLSSCLAYSFSLVTIALRVLQLLPVSSPAPAPVLAPESSPLSSPLPSPLPPQSPTTNNVDETFFEVTTLLITLILLGRYMEKIVKAKASHSVDALLKVQAKTAILLEPTENRESYIDVLLVERGDQLKVLPGARVPTDGVVVEGASSVDESMVTGESRKVLKEVGSKVIGGTINAQGVLVVRVTHTINESMLARIVHLVDEAQASKCVSQSVADAVSSYFTTFIITVAIIMFVVWYELAIRGLIDTRGWMPLPFALRFAITILVISCPCAISLAVPTVIMVATTIGSQFGVLFKGGHALEALDAIDVVMFDKTGTLTTGKLQVVDFLVASSFTSTSSSSSSTSGRSHHSHHKSPLTPRKLWTYLAAAERNSEHAIARAVLHYAKKVHTPHADVTGFQSIPGCGVRCRVDAHMVCVGSLKWMLDVLRVDVPLDLAARNELYQRDGCVVVCLAIDNALCALVALQDTPRPEAHFVIDQLRQRKIQTWIVTGDQRETAASVAAQLGIPDVCVIADALPHQKVDKVRLLQGIGKRVAFVGDGVNDGPALAMAHVGVAVGAGTDVAIESADLVLVKDDLRDLLNALDLSRATNRLIRWNFSWGFLYNLIMMPLACGALYPFFGIAIPPALAGLSELLSSVPVILFSLLLNFWKPPFPQSVGGAGDDDVSEGSFVAIDVRKDPMTEATPLLARH